MSIETVKYIRKPFEVEAVQVSADNISEVAEWCKGNVVVEKDEQDRLTQYIKVNVERVLNERQTKAFVGDWVLFAGQGYKVYTNKAFSKSFEKSVLTGVARDNATQAEKLQVEELRTVNS